MEKTVVPTERDQAIMRVMKSLARLRAHGNPLPARDARGVARLLVTLPSDRVGDVEEQVAGMGGIANVALAFADGFMIWSWDQSVEDTGSAVDIHEDASMDMLRLWVAKCEGRATFTLVRAAISNPREMSYQF